MSLTPEERSEITFTNVDTSDCGVVALQAALGLGRAAAMKLAKEYGYKEHYGIDRGQLEKAVVAHGWGWERVYNDHLVLDTPATFTVTHEYGVYLLYVDSHVMALVNGDLHNSKGHWGERLEGASQLLKP